VVAGTSYVLSTAQNVEDHIACDGWSGLLSWGFVRDQAITTASTGVGAMPGVLPKAFGDVYPSLLPRTRAGMWLYNTPFEGSSLAGSTIIEPGAQEYYSGGSEATSSC
jgi:hypothetical protein